LVHQVEPISRAADPSMRWTWWCGSTESTLAERTWAGVGVCRSMMLAVVLVVHDTTFEISVRVLDNYEIPLD